MLQPQLERVRLPAATRLVESNSPIAYVHFLEQGTVVLILAGRG
jgi:hypothetical protein